MVSEQTKSDWALIKALDPSAEICFSDYTWKFFIHAKIYLADGATLSGFTIHRDSVDELVAAYMHSLRCVVEPYWIAIRPDDADRIDCFWNGSYFRRKN